MSRLPQLDPWRLDASQDRLIYGLDAIGAVLGVCGKTARRWHDDPNVDVPIAKRGGRYCAVRSELKAWSR